MSKLDIGVGSEFPLDESRSEDDRRAWKEEHRRRRRAWRMHRHAHHHGGGHHHHGFLHLPLIAGVAVIAALIGAGRIPPLATEIIIGLAALVVAVAVIAHLRQHRRWHQDQQAR